MVAHVIADPIWWQDPRIVAPIFSGITSIITALIAVGAIYISYRNGENQKKMSELQLRATFREKRIHEFETNVALFLTNSFIRNASYEKMVHAQKAVAANMNPVGEEQKSLKQIAEKDAERHLNDLNKADFTALECVQSIKIYFDLKNPTHLELNKLCRDLSDNALLWQQEIMKVQFNANTRDKINNDSKNIASAVSKKAHEIVTTELESIFN